ncbi:nucleotidyltransferase domain-containing protein [Sphingomonas bacterium]|uniref:nucleotidyltransferase domain-containing protein n=1 Tax=Sphingomonas bacterium TaxID=1895847 RepID=UPI001576EC18|nr:nucleotidyltransferase domain-containing protein [Sphingomonas bacterium]
MRLTAEEVAAIKYAAREAFGDSAVIRLFGSRTDDAERGGDIDLHVEIDSPADEWYARGVFEDRLFRRIEPQKVDLIVSKRGGTPRGFERIAYRDGIVL